MSQSTKTYEGMFLVGPGSDVQAASQPIRNVLERSEADILSIKSWDERRLAYAIGGQRRGLYILTYFKADPLKVHEIEHDCQLSEDILRVLIIRKDKVSADEINAETPATLKQAQALAEAQAAEAAAEAAAEPAADKPADAAPADKPADAAPAGEPAGAKPADAEPAGEPAGAKPADAAPAGEPADATPDKPAAEAPGQADAPDVPAAGPDNQANTETDSQAGPSSDDAQKA